jgi:hypothetical protein
VTNPLPVVPEERILAAGFFDASSGESRTVTGGTSRRQDRLYLIDHGFAFGRTGDGYNLQLLQQRRVIPRPAPDGERGALHRLVGSPDLLGVAPLLQGGSRGCAARAGGDHAGFGPGAAGGWF